MKYRQGMPVIHIACWDDLFLPCAWVMIEACMFFIQARTYFLVLFILFYFVDESLFILIETFILIQATR